MIGMAVAQPSCYSFPTLLIMVFSKEAPLGQFYDLSSVVGGLKHYKARSQVLLLLSQLSVPAILYSIPYMYFEVHVSLDDFSRVIYQPLTILVHWSLLQVFLTCVCLYVVCICLYVCVFREEEGVLPALQTSQRKWQKRYSR